LVSYMAKYYFEVQQASAVETERDPSPPQHT